MSNFSILWDFLFIFKSSEGSKVKLFWSSGILELSEGYQCLQPYQFPAYSPGFFNKTNPNFFAKN
jgi:hypothetical protein